MGWTMFYLFIALKVPIVLAGLIVWWAVRQEPDLTGEDDGGARRRARPHPHKPLPRTPRRGPHGDPLPPSPPRVRAVKARARQLDR